MRILLTAVSAVLALSPAALIAQQAPPPTTFPVPKTNQHPPVTVIMVAPGTGSCPVGFSARRTPQGSVVQIDKNASPRRASINITLDARGPGEITSAEVTVSGIAGAHVIPADSGRDPGDVTERFTLSHTDTPRAHFESTVYTTRITGIRWVELNELTYSDGSTWHQKPNATCRISPSNLLLVNATN